MNAVDITLWISLKPLLPDRKFGNSVATQQIFLNRRGNTLFMKQSISGLISVCDLSYLGFIARDLL